MNDIPKKSKRGVYYDLTISPYEVISPYGDIFKFSSKKKMDIFTRDIEKEVARLDALLDRHKLRTFIPVEIIDLIKRAVYRSFYKQVER